MEGRSIGLYLCMQRMVDSLPEHLTCHSDEFVLKGQCTSSMCTSMCTQPFRIINNASARHQAMPSAMRLTPQIPFQ